MCISLCNVAYIIMFKRRIRCVPSDHVSADILSIRLKNRLDKFWMYDYKCDIIGTGHRNRDVSILKFDKYG